MSVPQSYEWDELSDAQIRTLCLSPSQRTSYGAELLDSTLAVCEDISASMKLGGDVHWAGDATIHRDCSVTIARELAWGVDLVQLFQTLTDRISGLSARRDVGVFCLQTPDDVLGEIVLPEGTIAYAVTGQDRLYLLDRQIGRSYYIASGTNVLAAVATALGAAGVSRFYIDGDAATATTPTDLVWPLVPGTGADTVDTSGGPATWLGVVNYLLALVNYRPLWCDEHGYYRGTLLVDPALVTPTFTFDATDTLRSPVLPSRTRKRDPWQQPNKWVFIRDNLGTDVPPVEGAGLYTVINQSDGLSSIDARNGLVWPTQITVSAADQATLVQIGNQQVAAAKRAAATYTVSTALFPQAGHFDVFRYIEATFGTTVVQASDWRIPLDGGAVAWSFTDVLAGAQGGQ